VILTCGPDPPSVPPVNRLICRNRAFDRGSSRARLPPLHVEPPVASEYILLQIHGLLGDAQDGLTRLDGDSPRQCADGPLARKRQNEDANAHLVAPDLPNTRQCVPDALGA
jgi:hypothetical protein